MVKEYFNSHYVINELMGSEDKSWCLPLRQMILHLTNMSIPKLCDTRYAVDLVGLDIYLSFIQDEKYVKLKNELPTDTIFLFADKFSVDNDGNFNIIPKITAILTKHKNESFSELFKSRDYYIYEIH